LSISSPKERPAHGPIATVLFSSRVRVQRGISQERLAFDAEVDRSYVGGLERQEENPTVDILDRLAKTLEVPISEFFREPRRGAQRPAPLKGGRRPSH
jgi:transcriptional regulator with XRE-family HTH domain